MIALLMVLIGAALLFAGGHWMVRGACGLAHIFKVPPLVVGLTVVSCGTSLPEAVTTFFAQLHGNLGDVAMGNVVGSNISNIGMVLGVSLLCAPLAISSALRSREMPLMLLASSVLIIPMFWGYISRWLGWIFLKGFGRHS